MREACGNCATAKQAGTLLQYQRIHLLHCVEVLIASSYVDSYNYSFKL
jgi:hypothetical protein